MQPVLINSWKRSSEVCLRKHFAPNKSIIIGFRHIFSVWPYLLQKRSMKQIILVPKLDEATILKFM